jgi:serine O-acetyltransferase
MDYVSHAQVSHGQASPAQFQGAWKALKADAWRQYGRFGWGALLGGALARRTFRVLVTMRLCQAAAASRGIGRLVLAPLKLLHRLAAHAAGMDLPWSVDIGPGLLLLHGWGLVISPGARIGANVTLFHGVTIGLRVRIARDGRRTEAYPTIEDEVWVGPHVTIVGGITIGRGSRIAAGAFVTEDVPPFSTVVGNPAAIVKRGCAPDVSNPVPL